MKKVFRWEPDEHSAIVDAYKRKCARTFSKTVNRAKEIWEKGLKDAAFRKANRIPIPEQLLPEYIEYWTSDPNFRMRSDQNKLNRAEAPLVTHWGGSLSIEGHRQKRVCLFLHFYFILPLYD